MGRGCRKRTLIKTQAELPSLRLRYWDWRLCLAARLDVSLSASYFQAQTAFRPELWLHQVRIWSQRGGGQHTVTGPREARTGLGGVSLLPALDEEGCQKWNGRYPNMDAGVKPLMRRADLIYDSA